MASNTPDSFQCGPFEVTRSPDVRQFVEKLNRLREAVDAYRIQPGVGYTLNRSSGGTSLTINSSSAATPAVTKRPFALSVRKKENKYQFYVTTGIFYNGTTIANLEQWVDFDTDPPAIIYLEAVLNNLAVQSATIKSQKQDETFKTVEMSGGKQAFARIALGSYSGSENSFAIVQNVMTNVYLSNVCFNGFPAVVIRQETFSAS